MEQIGDTQQELQEALKWYLLYAENNRDSQEPNPSIDDIMKDTKLNDKITMDSFQDHKKLGKFNRRYRWLFHLSL